MEEIIILGAGGQGREVAWLIENNNKNKYHILGFVDDMLTIGSMINGYPILGNLKWLIDYQHSLNVVIALGNPLAKKKVYDKICKNSYLCFPNIISDDVFLNKTVSIGIGCIICHQTAITTNITIGDFVSIGMNCTIGHDASIGDFTSMYPKVVLSGACKVGEVSEMGFSSGVIPKKNVGNYCVIGAGGIVIEDIPDYSLAVGVPAMIKKRTGEIYECQE